jgi:Flp pilus assembly protein TadG
MVEFAIVLPVLMMLLLAIIQFGIVFKDSITLTDAVRAGARTAAVSRNDAVPGQKAIAQVEADGGQNVSVTVPPDQLTPDGKWAPGATVTVTATHPYSISLFGLPIKQGVLSSTTKERVE